MSLQGVVVKYNANQRYATTAITASIIRQIANKLHVPLQVTHWQTCTVMKSSCVLQYFSKIYISCRCNGVLHVGVTLYL